MKDIAKQVDLITRISEDRGLPPHPSASAVAALPPGFVPCACNRKAIPISEVTYTKTSLLVCSDNLCRECRQATPQYASIVCIKCGAVVSRVKPFTDGNGFVVAPGCFYHIEVCPNCYVPPPGKPEEKELKSSKVLEKEIYMRKKYSKL